MKKIRQQPCILKEIEFLVKAVSFIISIKKKHNKNHVRRNKL